MRTSSKLATALVSALLVHGAHTATQQVERDPAREWLISVGGFGWFTDPANTVSDLRRIYHDAEVSLELEPDQTNEGRRYGQYVVHKDGETLFSGYCHYHVYMGQWTLTESNIYKDLDSVTLTPVTRNRRYRTVEGIGVGSTLGELRRAYPDKALSLYVGQPATVDPVVACMVRRDGRDGGTVVETLQFVIEMPASTRARRQLLRLPLRADRFDPRLKIVQIDTDGAYGCANHLDVR